MVYYGSVDQLEVSLLISLHSEFTVYIHILFDFMSHHHPHHMLAKQKNVELCFQEISTLFNVSLLLLKHDPESPQLRGWIC